MPARTSRPVSYRDTFRLLLGFAQKRLRKLPSALAVADLGFPGYLSGDGEADN